MKGKLFKDTESTATLGYSTTCRVYTITEINWQGNYIPSCRIKQRQAGFYKVSLTSHSLIVEKLLRSGDPH